MTDITKIKDFYEPFSGEIGEIDTELSPVEKMEVSARINRGRLEITRPYSVSEGPPDSFEENEGDSNHSITHETEPVLEFSDDTTHEATFEIDSDAIVEQIQESITIGNMEG